MIDKPSGIRLLDSDLIFFTKGVLYGRDYAGKQFPVRILQYDFFSGEFRIMQNVTGKRGSAGGT